MLVVSVANIDREECRVVLVFRRKCLNSAGQHYEDLPGGAWVGRKHNRMWTAVRRKILGPFPSTHQPLLVGLILHLQEK